VSVARVNYLNMGLVVASLAAAFVLPFEVFLFSYAVLGPLHYLTQISWMHKRAYFTKTKAPFDWMALFALAAGITAIRFLLPEHLDLFANFVFVAFGGALAMLLLKHTGAKLAALVVLAAVSIPFAEWTEFGVIFGALTPTIIHVCLFTACFVAVGALKGRDLSGVGLLGVYGACAAACFLFVPDTQAYVAGEGVRERYDASFYGLNVTIAHYFFPRPFTELDQVFASAPGLMIARFIAFSYTYHYLNWFSKTSVIKWHDVPRGWLVTCVVLWLVSLGIYAWDFRIGVATLGFLSLLHVFLEFPLNHATFGMIGRETAALVRGRAQGA
jgi:hypothetical protein